MLRRIFDQIERYARIGDKRRRHAPDNPRRVRFRAISTAKHQIGIRIRGRMQYRFRHRIARKIDFQTHMTRVCPHRILDVSLPTRRNSIAQFVQYFDFIATHCCIREHDIAHNCGEFFQYVKTRQRRIRSLRQIMGDHQALCRICQKVRCDE